VIGPADWNAARTILGKASRSLRTVLESSYEAGGVIGAAGWNAARTILDKT
jgi:hypothetical protein